MWGKPHHAGTTLSGATTEEHVLRWKPSLYKRRAVRPLQFIAPYARCMSASSTSEYSSYCLGNWFANADFQRDRCSRHREEESEVSLRNFFSAPTREVVNYKPKP
ncbi:hypothetical protein AVEN_161719-1 [Araneus ventricosus]|uniref:Uncharacterized protein n=1 Tax=Araneus ventricosus TaxID=182803 RepID=A0A4Y1ZL43_ARAVE|nr:hypothetical protein AVEN_161719-1 [Araneus ventricosus]